MWQEKEHRKSTLALGCCLPGDALAISCEVCGQNLRKGPHLTAEKLLCALEEENDITLDGPRVLFLLLLLSYIPSFIFSYRINSSPSMLMRTVLF